MGDEEASYGEGSGPTSAANDKLYEPKSKKTMIRVLTVFAYVFFVSSAALMLSAYYIFLWNPKPPDTRERLDRLVAPQNE